MFIIVPGVARRKCSLPPRTLARGRTVLTLPQSRGQCAALVAREMIGIEMRGRERECGMTRDFHSKGIYLPNGAQPFMARLSLIDRWEVLATG